MMSTVFPAARRLSALALLFAAAAALQGCIEAAVIGGAATTAYVMVDRRQPDVMLGDERVEIIASSRVGDMLKDQGHVNVTCYNYTALITGEVPTAQMKTEVEKIVSQVPQVKSVVNEIQVAGTSSLASRANDSYITSKVKGNFLSANKFSINRVKVVTEAGAVYLLGLVTREEADAATDIARGTGGAQKVVRVFEYVVAK
ncbi:MAG: BON domain-containing protein [Burkholderiales bacterium]